MAAFQAPPRGHECGSMVAASMQAGVTVWTSGFQTGEEQASKTTVTFLTMPHTPRGTREPASYKYIGRRRQNTSPSVRESVHGEFQKLPY